MQAALVESLSEVVDNVRQFNKDIVDGKDVKSQLRQFKHWYYIPSLGLFGPSKFVGYAAMNSEKYDRGRGKSGIETKGVLRKWFRAIPVDHSLHGQLMNRLEGFLAEHGSTPRSNSVIHVPKDA